MQAGSISCGVGSGRQRKVKGTAMLDKLKGLFGSKSKGKGASKKAASPAAPPKPVKMKKINLERRFTLVALTGQGSMSRVHKAIDNESGGTVCLKVQLLEKQAAANARADSIHRPLEGVIGSRIKHPHVVKTLDFGMTNKGEHFIVMEFIEGLSLAFIREAKSANLAEKLELLAQAAEGLAAVHAAGFIHHDIGPKNFLVTRENQVKLIDFGLAVPNTPAFRRPGNRTGTLLYMAPELIRRESIDERIDVYSFGSVAFEFLTDRLSYDTTMANSMTAVLQRLNSPPIDPATANPNLPEEVCDLLRKFTVRKKEDRWPKMETIPDALRRIRVDGRKKG
jgi:serine/threonine protein kinase